MLFFVLRRVAAAGKLGAMVELGWIVAGSGQFLVSGIAPERTAVGACSSVAGGAVASLSQIVRDAARERASRLLLGGMRAAAGLCELMPNPDLTVVEYTDLR